MPYHSQRLLKKIIRRLIDASAVPIAAYLAAVTSNPRFSNALNNVLSNTLNTALNTALSNASQVFKPLDVDFDPVLSLHREAVLESASFIKDHLATAVLFHNSNITHFWDFALSKVSREGLFCEFGVFNGNSINYFADKIPEVTWHGFDSFAGLPDDWKGWSLPKGTFDLQGKIPSVRENVELHKGWFDLTLPEFAGDNAGKISFMHIDCDLYSSAKTVFEVLGERIQAKTIIVFDEFFNYPGWQEHEYKAFMEFCAARQAKYSFIAFHEYRAAVMIEGISR